MWVMIAASRCPGRWSAAGRSPAAGGGGLRHVPSWRSCCRCSVEPRCVCHFSRRLACFCQTVGGLKIFFIRTPDRAVVLHRTADAWCLLYFRHYQEVLPADGVGQSGSQGPKIPIEQMFSDYVHTRGLSNWKFWIVSLWTVKLCSFDTVMLELRSLSLL